ncbi:hypothetical protein LSCM4_05967 [Leishmania orientalis]|uniref:ATP-dependent DNA helicase n=1 Tax=Leishmania orientalis TaxID=2249476 RepID=A0A836KSI5_9TRYP|nr:hypothetical protein LSCM4_05967 [Leishmania orientalis]
MHAARHAAARRWCHSQSRGPPSGGALPPRAGCRPAPSSEAAPRELGDAEEARPSLLRELLRRLQESPGAPVKERCTTASASDRRMEIDAEGGEAVNDVSPSAHAASREFPNAVSAERWATGPGASSESDCLRSEVGTREEVYVPLLFRPDFQRANPHARRHAAIAITAATAPTIMADTSPCSVAKSGTQAACESLRPRAPNGAAPAAARSPVSVRGAGATTPDDLRTVAAASSASVCCDDAPLEEFDIDSIPLLKRGVEEGEARTVNEEREQHLDSDASAAAASRTPQEEIRSPSSDDTAHSVADEDTEGVDDLTSGAAFPAAPASAAVQTVDRRSHRLILDPVEWLAQATDAPLMDEALLKSNTHIKDQLAEALALSDGTEYIEGLREQGHDAHLSDGETAIGKATPSAGDWTAMTTEGFDTARATAMVSASKRSIDAEEDTSLQEALYEELYADVSRAVRRQQWHRPHKKAKRSEVAVVTSPAHEDTNRERFTSAEHASAVPRSRENDAPTMRGKVLTLAAQSTALPSLDEGSGDTDGGALAPPCHEVATSSISAPNRGNSAAPAAESDALVYNIFTRRITKAGSMSIRALALMGIGVDQTTRELCVTDGEALRSLANELRAHRVSWPKLWSRGPLYQQIERLLGDATVEDPVERVADLLKLQYNRSHLQRLKLGFVASGDAAESVQAPSAAAQTPVAETIDDKLLTLQDLNAEQQAVVQLVMQGHNTYIGGGAGTGKSVLLRVIKQQLVREGLAVAVTGTTGIASSQIGGCTLHHCLGINPLGEFTRRKDLCSYDVIIIDEVSMLSRELFESLEVHLRRANSIDLPFGGVQMILSGDFLQLGAIHAQPLITSTVFRRYFVQLKLHTVVRQNGDLHFAAQLQQLRRGMVPPDLQELVRFMSREQVVAEHQLAAELRARQQSQLQQVLLAATSEPTAEALPETPAATPMNPLPNARRRNDVAVFVDGAVNLLPTNSEVDATNAEQLERLEGELITYTPQLLPPSLVGSWSPTYVLRICAPQKLNMKTLALEIQRYLGAFYTHGQRASSELTSRKSARPASGPKSAAVSTAFSDGSWLLHPNLSERSIVLYPLFVDALALRVRLPLAMDREEVRQFLLYLSELDRHLGVVDMGVRVRDILMHADGMHTEQDEFTLLQYAQRTPLARPLGLKIGARVMLRTNLAPGLVNGSLGTVVGFRRLEIDQLPRYIVGNEQRGASILQYANYLQYEQGFDVPLVPVIDFNGRQEVIPPVTHFVGGLPNTHHYSMGIVALPLSLAYAFTVHKVQGLTLVGRVHLELSRMWPCDHLLYVAMSRVRNPEQLSVSSFHPGLVRAAADCLLFDESLPPVTQARIAPYMVAATWRRSVERRKKVVLRKRFEAYVRKRQQKLQSEASRGDILAEIRLLEEKMLKQRARASAARRRHRSTPSEQGAIADPSKV